SAPAIASVTSAAPLIPNAMPTPSNDASAPIWSWPSGASPIATTQAPPARPRSSGGTLSCIRLWASRSASAPAALATIRMTMTPMKHTRAGARPRAMRLAPHTIRHRKAARPPAEPAAPTPQSDEPQHPAHRARGVHGAESLGADAEDVPGQAGKQRLVCEAEHLGAGGEQHEHGEHRVLPHRRDEIDRALPQGPRNGRPRPIPHPS